MEKSLVKQNSQLDNISEVAKNIATEDADDLAVMQYLAQVASTAQLVKMRKLEESKIPTGTKLLKYTVTDSIMKLRLYPPWISFSLRNDNTAVTPYGVTVWVNDENDPLVEGMVAYDEVYSCDMKYPVIKVLYLKAETGRTVPIRITGKEGRVD